MRRLRIEKAPWWAWVALALAPTLGYCLAVEIIEATTEKAPAVRDGEPHPFGCVWNPEPHGPCKGRAQ